MIGALSGVPGRRPAIVLLDLELEHAGHELGGVAQQLVHAGGGDRGVEAALLLRRAEHVAPVAARHEVAGARLAPAHDALQQAGARGVAQAQRLALDRAHARLVAEGARPRPGGDDDLLGAAARRGPSTSTPVRSTAPARSAARASAAHTRRGIDGVVVGKVQRAAQRRRERGLEPARGAGQQRLDVQPEALAQVALALERLGLVAIAGEHQRAARAVADVDAAGLGELRGEGGPAPRAAQPELEQRAARRRRPRPPARACPRRRARSRRRARRARAGAPTGRARGRARRRRGRRCRRRRSLRRSCRCLSGCRVLSLRRHDPDQLLTVGGRGAALSAQTKRAPVDHRW